MKIDNFIDCVYESNERTNYIKNKLMQHLPCSDIAGLANVLIIKTKNESYAVKIRWAFSTLDGKFDLIRTLNHVKDSDFKTIYASDYDNIIDYNERVNKTRRLIKPEDNIYLIMEIDESNL